MTLEISQELITPELAKKYLANQHTNRFLNISYAKRLAEDMLNGRWESEGDAIKFTDDDILFDGQHRLKGVCISGKPQNFIVIRGYKKDAMTVIDIGKPRTAAHIGQIAGLDIKGVHTACINALSLPLDAEALSVPRVLEMFNTYQDAIIFACQSIPGAGVTPVAPMRALIAKAYYYENHQRLSEFLNFFSTSFVKDPVGDKSATALRNYWNKNREEKNITLGYAGRLDWYMRCQLALTHFIQRHEVERIGRTKDTHDNYPIPGIQENTPENIKRFKAMSIEINL